jgi:hypothetical protein
MKSLRRKRVPEHQKVQLFSVMPYGLVGFCCIALALAQAALIGTRWLTILLSLAGMSIAGYAIWWRPEKQQPRDKYWFGSSLFLGTLIILLICFAPGVINDRWAIDATIAKPDPDLLTAVPREKAMQKGRELSQGESLDAATEAFRQDDVVIRIESAKIGQVPGKGETAYLLVQFRLVNLSQVESIAFEGFLENQPVLTDESGRQIRFIEQRLKQIKNRSVVFEEWSGNRSIVVSARGSQDVLLIFESPPGGDGLQLEVNSASWGRKGACRFQIAGISPSKMR